jgi:carbonic anhydrase
MTRSSPLNPDEAFAMLMAGNQRFVDGTPEHPNQDAQRRAELAPGQAPFAVLFGCSDSRLAAEIIFDRGLGDLFVVRTAGHVVGAEVLGSIEYAVAMLRCPLVVVLGHDSCGAVRAARRAVAEGVPARGYVRDVIGKVMPSVLAARAAGYTADREFVAEQILHTVRLLLDRSRILSDAMAAGDVAVAGLVYRLTEGTAELITLNGTDEVGLSG